MPDPRTIALDATYSVGDHLSGVGVYSREILLGLAAAHPEARFQFCYRPHRFARSWREKLPRNCHRFFLQEPILPRRADIFHGRWIFFEMDFVDKMFYRSVAPFKTLLRQKHLHMAAAQITRCYLVIAW